MFWCRKNEVLCLEDRRGCRIRSVSFTMKSNKNCVPLIVDLVFAMKRKGDKEIWFILLWRDGMRIVFAGCWPAHTDLKCKDELNTWAILSSFLRPILALQVARSMLSVCVHVSFLMYLQKSVVCPLGQKGTVPVREVY